MALSESEKLKCSRILGVDYIAVNDQIFNLGTEYITAEVETQVRELLDEWDAGAGRNFTAIMPVGENFGAKIDPSEARSAIRAELAGLLYLTDYLSGKTGNGQVRLIRG